MQQVGLFRLGRQAGRGTSALYIEDDQRELGNDGKVDGFRLEADARSGGGSDSQCPGKRCPDGCGTARYFVFTLYGNDAQRLVLGQFVQHIGGWGDGVRAQEQFQPGLFGGGNKAVSSGFVARDVHVTSGYLFLALDTASGVGYGGVRVVPVVPTGVDDFDVGFCHFGLLGKFLVDKVFRHFQVAVEQPAHQSHGKHVAAFQDGFVVHARVGQAIFYHLGDGGCNDFLFDAQFLDGVIGGKGCFFQVCFLESICIDDDAAVGLGEFILRFQRGSVHGYQHVALVAGCVHLSCPDVYLEARYARK